MLEDKKICVLMGGPGSEREVSLASGRAVLQSLQQQGLQAEGLELDSCEFELPQGTQLVYNLIHGTFGEDGSLQQRLQQLGVAYTGAGVASSRLAFDKILAKQAFVANSVPTPAGVVVDSSCSASPFGFPCVVKPPREGSSVGVHVVKTAEELPAAIADAASYSQDIMLEKFIKAKELTVAVIDDRAYPVVHIVPRSGFYDIKNKYPWMTQQGGTDYYCPADLSAELTAKVQQCALAAHRALGIEVYSRVDVLLDESGEAYVLEVNTIPGMTATSLLPKAAAASGMDFAQLCRRIGELSLQIARSEA